jgi:cytochrome c oxidase assembly protein subunit 11
MHKNQRTALNLIMIVLGMIMLTYSTPKLYKIFCAVTGFGGTPMVAKELPTQIIDRNVNIRFDTNIDHNLGWEFKSAKTATKIKVGENGFGHFTATNTTNADEYGIAAYNVTPNKAAKYFNKVQCFCFEKQLIKASQSMQFPVSFFIDPEFASDPYMDDVDTITLSYTFYKYQDKK